MAMDRGVLDQQLQELGDASRWWDLRELRDLPSVLGADEKVMAIARGRVARPRWVRRLWLVVVTDRRLLCMRSSSRSWRQLEVNVRLISRIALRVGPFRGRVLVTAERSTYRLLVPRQDAYKVHAALLRVASPAKNNVAGFAPTRMVRNMVEHVLALPAIAFEPAQPVAPRALPPPQEAAEQAQRSQQMEDQLQQLREQVEFLEQLLQQRGATAGAYAGNELADD